MNKSNEKEGTPNQAIIRVPTFRGLYSRTFSWRMTVSMAAEDQSFRFCLLVWYIFLRFGVIIKSVNVCAGGKAPRGLWIFSGAVWIRHDFLKKKKKRFVMVVSCNAEDAAFLEVDAEFRRRSIQRKRCACDRNCELVTRHSCRFHALSGLCWSGVC